MTEAESKWLPIESAPKDGTEIVAWGLFLGEEGWNDDWHGWTGVRWTYGAGVGYWQTTLARPSRGMRGFTPTHWLIAIPTPPNGDVRG